MKKVFTIAILALTVNAFAQVPTYIPTNGLVGWWPFNGNANDESGNNNHDIVNGATSTTDRFGNPNKAYYFSNNSISFTNSNFVAFDTLSFSCSVWFKFQNTNNAIGNFVRYHDCFSPGGWGIRHLGNSFINGLEFEITNNNVISTTAFNTNTWHNAVFVRNTQTKQLLLYIDGVLSQTVPMQSNIVNRIVTGMPLFFGTCNSYEPFYGSLDDIAIWNRALTQSEISNIYHSGLCVDTTLINVQIIYVSDPNFKGMSPKIYYESTDSLRTSVGGCDSIIKHYTQYVFLANYCTDTIYLTVTDTLIINVNLITINPLIYQNTIKIYPNPTSDHITIDFGSNYSTMNGYTLKITNSLSQVVYITPINIQQTNVDLSTWTGKGICYVHLIDETSNTIDIRKIVLQ